MSSEEAGHVSLMEVTPTSGKGTLGTWWFLRVWLPNYVATLSADVLSAKSLEWLGHILDLATLQVRFEALAFRL